MKLGKRESKDSLHISFLECMEKLTKICHDFSKTKSNKKRAVVVGCCGLFHQERQADERFLIAIE